MIMYNNNEIFELSDGFLIKVPMDVKKPQVNKWSDDSTTVEFFSNMYEQEYDSDILYADDEKDYELKEITISFDKDLKVKIEKYLNTECNSIINTQAETDVKYIRLKKV